MATTGNAMDFGDMSQTGSWLGGGLSSPVRALFGGSYDTVIEYVTIATKGNTTNFGDLTDDRGDTAAVSDSVRGVWGGGRSAPGPAGVNTLDYVTIMTEGNAVDFGDFHASVKITLFGDVSSGHGGLG
jgi:hypothetical protein